MKKIGVWQFECGIVRLYNADVSDTLLRESGDVVSFLGYIEVEEPKKTVTKELVVECIHRVEGCKTLLEVSPVPHNIKNPRLVFDVEE